MTHTPRQPPQPDGAAILVPSRDQALEAVRTMLAYLGEDPNRPGLLDTPDRVLRAMAEQMAGYREDPVALMGRVFEDITGYEDLVVVRNITFVSMCEHHLMPILGTAFIAYWPGARIVGISKLARLVDVFARRLQSQETLTRQIADVIAETLEPRGQAVMIRAQHQCMTTRGVAKAAADCVTTDLRGCLRDDYALTTRFLAECRM